MELADINRREILRYLGYKTRKQMKGKQDRGRLPGAFVEKMFRLNTRVRGIFTYSWRR